MSEPFFTRLKHAWNAFINNKDSTINYGVLGSSYYYRPDRQRFTGGNERTIVTSVYNRIALDVSAVEIKHVRIDENDRYKETINSGINSCFNTEANIDQTGRAFIQDIVMSMLDEGCVAIVPIDTTTSPVNSNTYDILSMRTGKILQWYPNHVQVRVYNEKTGNKEAFE